MPIVGCGAWKRCRVEEGGVGERGGGGVVGVVQPIDCHVNNTPCVSNAGFVSACLYTGCRVRWLKNSYPQCIIII